MIKLKNVDALGFLSPSIAGLFNDTKRTFPTEIAFKISDAVSVIRARLAPYHEGQKKIIEANNGIIAANGSVTYLNIEDQLKATKDIDQLNQVELEYPIEPIKMSSDWPFLTLAEATILRPILAKDSKQDAKG